MISQLRQSAVVIVYFTQKLSWPQRTAGEIKIELASFVSSDRQVSLKSWLELMHVRVAGVIIRRELIRRIRFEKVKLVAQPKTTGI
jgi:hypothetical protein